MFSITITKNLISKLEKDSLEIIKEITLDELYQQIQCSKNNKGLNHTESETDPWTMDGPHTPNFNNGRSDWQMPAAASASHSTQHHESHPDPLSPSETGTRALPPS